MSLRNIIEKVLYFFLLSLFMMIPNYGFSQEFESNIIIVKLKPEHASFFKGKNNLKISGIQINKASQIVRGSNRKNKTISNIYKLSLADNNQILETCQELFKSSLFEYCQPSYYDKILYTPSDPKASIQYTLNLTHAFDAWDIHKGDSNIVVGITDTGIDFNHEDLRGNVFYNLNDPIDGVDNDFDGYIDNFMGWDFGSGDNNPQWDESGSSGDAIHGTFTSGLAGARTDNAIGMASVGFSNKILPIKISDNFGAISTGYESIIYAAEHGCQIINCSWGSTSPHDYGRDVIRYVTEELGVIVVGAAGNDNNEVLFYPASYDNVISVAASNSIDEKWPNSSYNWRVDISAPGQNVLSTLSNSSYNVSSGTSFAAPIVASALSLILSYYPDTLSNVQIIEILKSTSDYIDTVGTNTAYKNKLGSGRLNLHRALLGNFGPALSYQDFEILTNGTEAYAGDTAEFSGYITNYLTSTENVIINISSSSQYVEILDSTFTISSIGENEIFDISNLHLKLIVNENTPDNKAIEFMIHFEGETYHNLEMRVANIVFPSIEMTKNRLHTTLFAEARLAYSYDYRGFGLKLDEGDNMLYEMGIIAGYSDQNTIANVRSYRDFSSSNHLDSVSTENRWHAQNTISSSTIPMSINARYEVFDDSLYQNIFFIHYKLANTSAQDLSEFYLGVFADWDIFQYQYNYTSIDTSLKLALTHCYYDNKIAGMQLLSHTKWHRYAMDNINNFDYIYSRDGLTRTEMYYALSNNNYIEGVDNNGTDILDLLSAGPFEFNINDTLELSFAILADTSEQGIIASGQLAQQLYDSLYHVNIGIIEIDKQNPILLYPNPAKDFVLLKGEKLKGKHLQIYNSTGRAVGQMDIKEEETKIDVSGLSKGIYLVRIGRFSKKLLIE